MNRLGHLDCLVSAEVVGLHQPKHDFQAPDHRNSLCLAGITQRPIVRQACPAIVSGQDQAELVFERQGAATLGGLRHLGQATLHEGQSDPLALGFV